MAVLYCYPMAEVNWYFPIPDGVAVFEADRTAEHWVLELLREFAGLQATIGSFLHTRFCEHSAKVADLLRKKHLARLSDDDRWSYVEALTTDVGYDDDLVMAKEAFFRCRSVRNVFAHPQFELTLATAPGRPEPHYVFPSSLKTKSIPDPLTPGAVRQLGADCRWLTYLVTYLSWRGSTRPWMRFDPSKEDNKVELVLSKPPPLPVSPDWTETSLFQSKDDAP